MDVNEVIRRFAGEIGGWVRRENRVSMTSPLYDLPGRSFLGFAVVEDVAAELIERMEAAVPAEELGARVRAPLMRPYVLQGIMVIESQLMARQQWVLDAGGAAPGEADAARTQAVIDWCARMFAGYRTDEHLFAGSDAATQPILPDPEPWLVNAEGAAADPQRLQRAFGALELYALTLHGEQRDGQFDHGPYPLDDGWAAFHEVNDLCNDVLPWSDDAVRLPVDAVGAVRVFGGEVEPAFELFGTMSTRPASAPFTTTALWAREGDALRPLALEELEALAAQAMEATTLLFRRIAAWDADYRIAYGAPLFLNHLMPFARLAGVGDARAWLTERAAATTASLLPRLREGVPLSVWSHLEQGDDDMFALVGGAA